MHPYFDLITKYFPKLSEDKLDKYANLWDIYHYWNSRINVISRKDIDELYIRHVLHSLSIASLFDFVDGSKVLDVGTGGGFPGIPLGIYFDKVQFTLVDSIGKKIKVVDEVITTLNLQNCTAVQLRGEEVEGKFDLVVSRAVTGLPKFIHWVGSKVVKGNSSGIANGILYIKGGDLKEELSQVKWKTQTHELSKLYHEPFFETKKVVHLIKS